MKVVEQPKQVIRNKARTRTLTVFRSAPVTALDQLTQTAAKLFSKCPKHKQA